MVWAMSSIIRCLEKFKGPCSATTTATDPGSTSAIAATHDQTASLPRYDVTLLQNTNWNSEKAETSSSTYAGYCSMGPWISSSAYSQRALTGSAPRKPASSNKLG